MRMLRGRRDRFSLFLHPMLQHIVCLIRKKVFLDSHVGAQRHTRLEMERRSFDNFSGGHFATRPTRNWCQNISACKLMLDSPQGTVEHFIKSYVTHMPRLQGTWVGL